MQSEVEVAEAARGGDRSGALLRPGRNCLEVATAERAALLVDAEAYFATLEEALWKARRSIFILAWDFDARIRLRPQDGSDAPTLGTLLRSLVEERPELQIRILVWSLAAVHAPGATLPLVLGAEWQNHPRIHLRLDTHHPLHAAHHQKVVVIDDSLAFVGGMDLTIERWDNPSHEDDNPMRACPDGALYDPVHDVQMAIDGPAARVVAGVVRQRWSDAVDEEIPLAAAEDRWPQGLAPEFTEVSMGIARTAPRLSGSDGTEEAAQLTEDLLRAAKRTVYIEAQYFTSKRVRKVLRQVLARPEGPEIVVICTRTANGVVERFIMGANRERLLRNLKRVDRHNRLHVYYPVVPGENDPRLLVHSKLMIVDDRILRVGSANLNNRSVGLDTECDVAIEADRPETSQAIAHCRERLLGEHLGVDPALVRAAVRREGSLVRAIERLNHNERGLRPMDVTPGATHSFPGTRLLDPERPFRIVEGLRALWSRRSAHSPRRSTSSDASSSKLPSTRGSRK